MAQLSSLPLSIGFYCDFIVCVIMCVIGAQCHKIIFTLLSRTPFVDLESVLLWQEKLHITPVKAGSGVIWIVFCFGKKNNTLLL